MRMKAANELNVKIFADGADLKGISNRSEEHTSELQSQSNLVCRLLLEKKKKQTYSTRAYSTHPSHTQRTSEIKSFLVRVRTTLALCDICASHRIPRQSSVPLQARTVWR